MLTTLEESLPMSKDYCTGYFEYSYSWKGEKIYIGDCCKIHDSECNTMNFIKCLWKKKIVGTVLISSVAMLACLVRYFKL